MSLCFRRADGERVMHILRVSWRFRVRWAAREAAALVVSRSEWYDEDDAEWVRDEVLSGNVGRA